MRRLLPTILVLAVVGILCVVFPPFHIRSLRDVREAETGARFNAGDFASGFWTERLLPAVTQSAKVAEVFKLMETQPESVRERFGRTVGVSSSYFLFVHGVGRVVGADEDRIALSLRPEGNEAQILIPLGFVFGNAVRDGTGLLNPSDYPNAQEFNDIAAALNSMVETNVLPRLQQIATIGSRVRFAGCAEVADEELDLNPLTLVPIAVEPE